MVMRAIGVCVAILLAGAGEAHAAHPCGDPYLRMELLGRAYVGEPATFRYEGPIARRIDWGDGTVSGRRRVVGDRLRHRFRRRGTITVTVVQDGFGCCTSDHASCSSPQDVVRTVQVRVRRRR